MLSILIPAYDEQDTVGETVESIAGAFAAEDISYEILVVNDGSSDATEQSLEELQARCAKLRYVTNPGPFGYGCAVRYGLQHYEGDAVIIAMADGSDPPGDMIKYYEKIQEGFGCGFGSRFIPGARVENYPRLKLVLNRVGNHLIALLVRKRYNDFTNGFKCYSRDVIDNIQPLISGRFNLTVEMSIRAALSGASIGIVPNNWRDRSAGQSSFKVFGEAWLYLLTILYCLLSHRIARAVSRPKPME